jgi:hypothetical protein
MFGEQNRYILGIGGRLRKRKHSKILDIDGRIIFKCILKEVGWGGKNWIALAKDGDSWRSLLNVVMNIRVSQKAGNFLSS